MMVGLLGARAQIKLPISKMTIEAMKVPRREKYWYNFPQTDWVAARVRKNAEPYQPTSARELNSDVIRGIAVDMMLCTRVLLGKERRMIVKLKQFVKLTMSRANYEIKLAFIF
jgi:hypothetical protein